MARPLYTPTGVWAMAKGSLEAWINDYAPSMGAALAYYTAFALAPLLIVVIAIAGVFFGADAARGQIVNELRALIGEDGASAVQALLLSASHPATSVAASIIGLVTLLLGATSVFAELQSALDRIWRSPVAAQHAGVWNLMRRRLLSFGLIVSVGFLLLVSLVLSAGLSAADTWGRDHLPGWRLSLQLVNLIASFVITTVLFAMIYQILPRVRVAWRDVWIGSVVTALLFSGGKWAIGVYLGRVGFTSGFGAAGSLVVLLAWVYYSAQIFLLGAEFTWLYARTYGSHRHSASPTPQAEVQQKGLPVPAPAGSVT